MKLAECLIEEGANINHEYYAALHIAVINGYQAETEFLLKRGADIDRSTCNVPFLPHFI